MELNVDNRKLSQYIPRQLDLLKCISTVEVVFIIMKIPKLRVKCYVFLCISALMSFEIDSNKDGCHIKYERVRLDRVQE